MITEEELETLADEFIKLTYTLHEGGEDDDRHG